MNIIYIDDDATNRAVLRGMLEASGVKMAEAPDAQTGLKMIDEGDYAIVLMDLRMPGVSGLTAIRQLRSIDNANKQIPIVVVTADLTDGVRDLCRGAGADDFVAKPVGMADLFDAIGSAVAKAPTLAIQ